jgi:hypothetical protein
MGKPGLARVRRQAGLSPGSAAVITNDLIKELLQGHLPTDDPCGMRDFT